MHAGKTSKPIKFQWLKNYLFITSYISRSLHDTFVTAVLHNFKFGNFTYFRKTISKFGATTVRTRDTTTRRIVRDWTDVKWVNNQQVAIAREAGRCVQYTQSMRDLCLCSCFMATRQAQCWQRRPCLPPPAHSIKHSVAVSPAGKLLNQLFSRKNENTRSLEAQSLFPVI